MCKNFYSSVKHETALQAKTKPVIKGEGSICILKNILKSHTKMFLHTDSESKAAQNADGKNFSSKYGIYKTDTNDNESPSVSEPKYHQKINHELNLTQ